MKRIILLCFLFLAKFSIAQNTNLESFKSKFAVVANKSTAWNSLIDFLKPTNTLNYYKLTEVAVWKDPCMVMQQYGASCPQIDYYNYFKRATGKEEILSGNINKFTQEYTFETNSRPGKDTVTNIDTIRSASFVWKLIPQPNLSKKQIRKIYLQLFNDICTVINGYYGTPIDEPSDNNNVEARKYWTYRGNGTALARIVLFWSTKSNEYRIVFSGNIARAD